LGELKASSLSYEQMEKICEVAEEAARKNVMSRVPSRGISDLSISVDAEQSETVDVEVDVEIMLSPLFKNINVEELAEESVEAAFEAVEKYVGEIECQLKR
jgi:hypothetical protein